MSDDPTSPAATPSGMAAQDPGTAEREPSPVGADDGTEPPGLSLTGERTLPDIPDENYWFQRHVAAYRHVAARVHGTVVDAGCGEGYGLRILRDAGARGVIGVDGDEATVEHARARYASESIEVVEADLADLPLVVDTMDATVSLQVIEHIREVPDFLAELARITRPGGTIAISTPNRLTFTPGSTTPTNPFHVREYTADELRATMEEAGISVDLVEGLHHGPTLAADLAAQLGDDGSGRLAALLADPEGWSDDLRRIVHAITPDSFRITPDDVDASLDLLAWGRV